MKKKALLLASTMLLTFILVACGGASNNAPANKTANNNGAEENVATEGASTDAADLKIGFVTDEGGINDQSFNQGVWEGLNKTKDEFGVAISYQESNEANDYAPNLETLLDDGNNLILAAGFNLGDAILAAAEANPDTNYAIIDYAYENGPSNLVGITFKDEEPSFLVGYIAGLTTESNKVGFIGGQESTVIDSFEFGYKAGVAYAAKELGKEIEVTSQYVGDFSDAGKGKSIATNMYQQGHDIIFHAAGGAGDGVIEAAKDQDKWVIGVDRDQYDLAPENVLTSAMKRADSAVYNIVKELSEGKEFPGGTTVTYGLAEGDTVDIAPTSDKNVKPEILEKLPEIKEKIISGEIKVPSTEEEFQEFTIE